MNSKYAPYLPANEGSLSSTNHYVRMLDKKFSLQPLLQALEKAEKVPGMHEPSTSGLAQKMNVSKEIDKPFKSSSCNEFTDCSLYLWRV